MFPLFNALWQLKTYQTNTVDHVVVEEEEDVVQRQRAHQVQEEPGPGPANHSSAYHIT
jgi:hypothetical protein